jgi:hypothetical protein
MEVAWRVTESEALAAETLAELLPPRGLLLAFLVK